MVFSNSTFKIAAAAEIYLTWPIYDKLYYVRSARQIHQRDISQGA